LVDVETKHENLAPTIGYSEHCVVGDVNNFEVVIVYGIGGKHLACNLSNTSNLSTTGE
jgi:hypothetical protein